MSSTKSAPSRFNQGPGRPAQARQGSSRPSRNTGGSSSKRKKTPQKFKRIRGLLTGESRRERKVKKEQEAKVAAAAGKKPPVAVQEEDEEDETIYGVDFENQSVVNTVDGDGEKESMLSSGMSKESEERSLSTSRALQVILLLMDPKTRRFELLQLEFDSHKAVVRDVLSQIPHSVTEEALRQQNYTGVCDRTGQELYYSTRLADVCNGSDILIALPSTVEARECARLAKPILQDRNVIEMLRASGVDVASLEKREVPPSPKKPLAAPAQTARTAVPVAPPASPVAAPRAAPRAVPVAAPVAAHVSRAVPVPAPPAPVSKNRSAVVATPPTPPVETKKMESNTLFIILLVGVAILIQVVHMSVTAPLNPGHTLSPNAFMSKCGYKAWLPICQEQSLVMDDDGSLTLYGSDGAVEWEMLGAVCKGLGCKNGLVVNMDGTLEIGGKRVNAAAIYGDPVFTPWPFTFSPAIRLVKGRR